MGAIHRIFEGSPGKAQAHSKGFRWEICDILNSNEESKVAISWCLGHQGIIGNEEADNLAKLGSKLNPDRPNYKTQAYVVALHKWELLEALETQVVEHTEPPQHMVPTSQQNPTITETHREIPLNG